LFGVASVTPFSLKEAIIATDISICSAALLQLGKAPIASFNQPGDLSKLCANIYPIERDSILREFAWNCVTTRTILAALSLGPAFGFTAQFALPADFLRLIGVGGVGIDEPTCMRYKVEGRKILASGVMLPIEYVTRADESTWDSKLVELMTARMLWKLAYPVTQSTSLRETLSNEYAQMAKVARNIDSQENPAQALSDDYPLIQGRG
jgi:hypothetical protein